MSAGRYITLSELQKLIRKAIDTTMPLSYWITAEISEIKVNYSGHCYMELVEKGSKNGVPCAKVNAVVWRSTYGALSSYFQSSTGAALSEGMKVLMKVSVNYHELYGLSLVVSDIDPLYTVGDMERQRQMTISQLQEEGVFDMNRSVEIPMVVQRIAVVSSRNAAGYQDFMNELAASGFHFYVTLFDAFMQGKDTEDSVISALDLVSARLGDFDVVVVIRGGGSQSDLGAFDSYRLCCHIAQFPLPVFTGIGHDKDHSVADMVASVSLKTPTAVAAYLCECICGFDSWLESAMTEITGAAVGMIEEEWRFLSVAGNSLYRTSSAFTHELSLRLATLAGELRNRSEKVLGGESGRLGEASREVNRQVDALLRSQESKLLFLGKLAESQSPEKILSLGFAIVRKDGRAVKDEGDVAPGDILEVEIAKGKLKTEVKPKDNGKGK